MPHLSSIYKSLRQQPAYTLMRAVARFSPIRRLVAAAVKVSRAGATRQHLAACERALPGSVFGGMDRQRFVQQLERDGVGFGLKLPSAVVAEILSWTHANPCYADRNTQRGFALSQRDQAEAVLSKPILLGQYFNTTAHCPPIRHLAQDPLLLWIASTYLGSKATFVGANLWWTFPVEPLESDRHEHAHLFHRDVDDFRFVKFFFYLTEVSKGEGAHVCVAASHRNPPRIKPGDQWKLRRFSDEEISHYYPSQQILEICGEAGTGFAENTLCIHKGSTPKGEARLLLQLQYALFDYGAMHDRRDPETLAALI